MRKLTVLLAAGATLLAPTAARADHTQKSIFEDDARLLYSTDAVRTSTLNELQSLGVDQVHVPLVWATVAPSPTAAHAPSFASGDPAAYPAGNWARYDAVIRSAQARHMSVLLTVTGPGPRWAEGCHYKGRRGICRPSATRFGRFVRAVGTRYSGRFRDASGALLPRVSSWSVWNEPNLYKWIYPQWVRTKGRTINAAAIRYRALFAAAATALHATRHRRDTILLGETSPIGRTGGSLAARTTPPRIFLREVFCLDSRGRAYRGAAARARSCTHFPRLGATGLAHHPYTPVAACTPRCPGAHDDITIATLGRLTNVADEAARAGRLRRGAGLYLTEFGFQSNPPDRFSGISLAQQATYINWADYIAFRNPRVRTVAQFELLDDGRNGAFQTGLRRSDGRAKPSLGAYRMPIFVVRSGRSHVQVFGQVRPRGGGKRVTLEHRTSKRGKWRRVTTLTRNSAGYVYRRVGGSGGWWRLSWSRGGGQPTLHSRAAGVY
jgi:hypothetical protein